MQIETFVTGLLDTNTYVVWNEARAAYLIDPGADGDLLLGFLEDKDLKPLAILLTHAHFDHIGAVPEVVRALDGSLPVCLAAADHDLYASPLNAMLPFCEPVRGLPKPVAEFPAPPAGLEFQLLATPGHTPGSVSFYFPASKTCFSGDALFRRSVGRTDLPGSSSRQLADSIGRVLFALPKDTKVLPGHGDATTIDEEMRLNPFVSGLIY